MTRQEIVRRSQAKRRERLKAAGKCVQCGADPKPGRTLCPVCMAKQVKYSMRYKEKKSDREQDNRWQ